MPTLSAYQTALTNLIQAPNSPEPLISPAQQTVYINTARGQVATEAECIRVYGTLAVTAASQRYPFTAISLAGTLGVQGPINLRMVSYQIGADDPPLGAKLMVPREWEWFNTYIINNVTPVAAPPKYWAQYGQGASGTIFVNLLDSNYTLNIDTACYPADLADDSSPEAIPYQWTDAVPFYAAWLAMMNEQRQPDADRMLQRYASLMARARSSATPSVLGGQYAQGPDPVAAQRLGVQPRQQGQAA